MKKLIIGLLTLSSLSTFATDITLDYCGPLGKVKGATLCIGSADKANDGVQFYVIERYAKNESVVIKAKRVVENRGMMGHSSLVFTGSTKTEKVKLSVGRAVAPKTPYEGTYKVTDLDGKNVEEIDVTLRRSKEGDIFKTAN